MESSTQAESRRIVTVLFCDLVGSTALGERLDPEPLRHVMVRYYTLMRSVLGHYGGTVEKFIGDAVMGVFGVPVMHEDDALRAVYAAIDMRDAVAQLDRDMRDRLDLRLAVRIGICTGEVVASGAGDDQMLVSGDVVNVAARLQQAAGVGDILISGPTHKLVRRMVVSEPMPPPYLKGKARPVEAWVVRRVLPVASGIDCRMNIPLVDRDHELRYLWESFERVRNGCICHLFTLLGEPGVGKSRLAAEFLTAASEAGALVLVGRCRPFPEGGSFGPLAEMIRRLKRHGGGSATDAPADNRGPSDGWTPDDVAGLVAQTLGDPVIEAAFEQTSWAVRKLLESAAPDRGLVVAFDDIQWAKPALLDLIEYLADWVRDVPVMLLCIGRLDLLDRRCHWSGGKLSTSTILLTPLRREPAAELVREQVDVMLHANGADRLVERVAELAGGNPLFIEQMLAAIRDGSGTDELPLTLQALIGARLDRLNSAERTVLELAAMVGREFAVEMVRDMCPPEATASLETVLAGLTRRQMIEPVEDGRRGQTSYRFCNVRIREVAREGLPKRVRAEMHERIGEWLSGHLGAAADEDAGRHMEQAMTFYRELGLVEDVARVCVRTGRLLEGAARLALARGDLQDAVDLLERALAALPEGDSGRVELLIRLGDVLLATAQRGPAEQVLRELLSAAGRSDDSRARVRALLGLNQVARPGPDPTALLANARRAIPVLSAARDELGLAKAWSLAGEAHRIAGRFSAAAGAFERSLACAAHAGMELEQASIVGGLTGSLWLGPMPAALVIDRCEELLSALPEARLLVRVAASCPLAALLATRNRFAAADRLLSHAELLADELGHAPARGYVSLFGGTVRALAGDLAGAEDLFRAARRSFLEAGEDAMTAAATDELARILVAQGGLIEARTLVFESTSEVASGPDLRGLTRGLLARQKGTRALLLSALRRHAEAAQLAAKAVRSASATDSPDLQAVTLMDHAHVLESCGERLAAASDAAAALDRYQRKGNLVGVRRAETFLGDVCGRRS